MRAVIAGAGIAGLVAARQLGLAGWQVDVLERSPGPREDGYMMDFFGPGVHAAQEIGLYDTLAAVAYRVVAAAYVDARGRETARLDYARFSRLAGGDVLSLLRPDMEEALRREAGLVPGVRLHYGVRASGVDEQSGRVFVNTGEPGHSFTADVLIGADGLHSAVRQAVFGPEQRYLRDLGMRAAAYIVHEPRLNELIGGRFLLTDSLGCTAACYGLRDGRVAALLVYGPAPGDPQQVRERLRARCAGLGELPDRLLALCPADPYDDVVAQVVMPRCVSGRTVLLGDAGGAVSLLAGQGGSLAVAGAARLAGLLGPLRQTERIPSALADFEQRWRPTVDSAQAAGRRAAANFLPQTRTRLLMRRWVLRAAGLPLVDRIIARQISAQIAR